ncbi:MAG: transcriptional repressor [Bacilli bacterium]|jgi:Fur family ferric uptake transcriptional regulator|nr:transcriptional repressor [Bacilli bacterium]
MKETNWPKDFKKTKIRQEIINILRLANKPLSAFEIQQTLIKNNYKVWPSTLYRSLDAFEKAQIITKFSLTNSSSALYELKSASHAHYAICLDCQKMFPILNCPLVNFEPEINDHKFIVVTHKMELYGYCQKCLKIRENSN